MRDIKFRAFVKHIGWLVPVCFMDFKAKTVEVDLSCGQGDTSEYSFDEVELMQYTGIEDKNGTEICKGDVVLNKYNMLDGCDPRGDVIDKIILDSDVKVIEFKFHRMNMSFDEDELEVIGNIYENPELLEGE